MTNKMRMLAFGLALAAAPAVGAWAQSNSGTSSGTTGSTSSGTTVPNGGVTNPSTMGTNPYNGQHGAATSATGTKVAPRSTTMGATKPGTNGGGESGSSGGSGSK